MIRLALERPISTFIAAATLVAIGAFSLWNLPASFLPELQRPDLEILTRSDGRSQDEMLHGMTRPLEQRLTAIPGIRSLRSETRDGISRVRLETRWQTDADRLLIEVARRIDGAGAIAIDDQTLMLVETELAPVVEVALTGGTSSVERDAFARKVLLPELARIPGAGRLEAIGMAPLHVVVRPRVAALASRNLTTADLLDRLERVGRPVSAGRVREGAAVRPMIARETVASLEELGQVQIAAPGGATRLKDLATFALEEISDGSSCGWNGEPGVLFRLFRAPGANAVDLSRRVDKTLERFRGRANFGFELTVVADSSREVVAALSRLGLAAFAGILLGTLVLRFMLGTWAPTLALAIVIPASMLTAFAAFYFWGLSLNVISIAGLALASGLLVDNSVIVLEAIETARAQGIDRPRLAGTRQIAVAVVASAVTTIVVFLPLLYLRGLARAFFGEQAFAIVSSLGASLLFSLTLTPVLARRRRIARRLRAPGLGRLLPLLDRTLARPFPTVALGTLLVGASLLAAWTLPRALFPEGEERVLRIEYRLAPQLTAVEIDRQATEVESVVRAAVPDARLASMLTVRDFDVEGNRSVDRMRFDPSGRIDLELDSAAATRETRQRLTAVLGGLPDVSARVLERPGALTVVAGAGQDDFEVVVSAADEAGVIALARRISAEVESGTGLRPAASRKRRQLPVFRLRWDEQRLARLSLDRNELERQTRVALQREQAGRIDMVGVRPEILVESGLAASPGLLTLGPIDTQAGSANGDAQARIVPLAALASIEPGLRPALLYREDGRPAIRLQLESTGETARARDAIGLADLLAGIPLAADENARLAGAAQEVASSFHQLRLALLLSLLLVFLTLAAVYESLLLPLLIMTTVPAAGGGAFGLLALTGQSLNIMSFLGLILLGGIVVNNAIVLVHRIEQHRRAGQPEATAVRDAVAERYRPILMTTLTTMIGMLPLALLGGEGVELRRALATAVLGGLVTATFASLLFVPALHAIVEPFRSRVIPERVTAS